MIAGDGPPTAHHVTTGSRLRFNGGTIVYYALRHLPIIGHRKDGRPIYLVAGGAEGDALALPEDLSTLTDDELAALREQATGQFDEIYAAEGGASVSDLARATQLADAIEALDGERGRRQEAAAEAQTQFEQLRSRVHGGPDDNGNAATDGEPEPVGEPAGEPALTAGSRPTSSTRAEPRETGGLHGQRGQLNASLRGAQNRAPDPRVPDGGQELVITAAAATSGAPIGHRFTDLGRLSRFINQHSRSLSVTNGSPSYTPFVTLARQYRHVLGESTDPATVEQILGEVTNPQVLTAAGGWCAPSEPRYDFFNVACEARTGVVDLPGIGIDRGGIKWPVSPSLADVFTNPAAFAPFGATFNASSVPWLWTENDDIAAVTGTGTKPCIRIPCVQFSEARLECFGYCLTAGNLADAAFPESTANFLKLLMAAQIRVENFRYLAQMTSLSTLATAVSGTGCAGAGTASPVLGALELAAIDYRTKYGQCDDDVLEVILPTWIKGAIRSDLSKRTGVDFMNVTDQMIANWFDSRGVRAQLVGEYQARTAGFPGGTNASTSWPSTVEFMMYAAGTFVRGDGMSLDLGVVRDSTLNKTNDHTAAWTEECHLIARIGHESRRHVVPICVDGTTGAADNTACCL